MLIILHNIRSKFNVGSIFRTADACGAVSKIYLCGYTPAPIDHRGKPNSGLLKVSLGAEKFIAWEQIKQTWRLLDRLKKQGYAIYGVELSESAVPYFEVKLPAKQRQKTVLVLGNEVKGLSPALLKRTDQLIEIPMYGQKESLNVAVAFGIVIYGLIH